MTLLTSLRRIFRRPQAVDVAPGVDAAVASSAEMQALADKLAAKRGDNISIAGAGPSGTSAASQLAENADMAGIVSSTREDNVLSGRDETPLI